MPLKELEKIRYGQPELKLIRNGMTNLRIHGSLLTAEDNLTAFEHELVDAKFQEATLAHSGRLPWTEEKKKALKAATTTEPYARRFERWKGDPLIRRQRRAEATARKRAERDVKLEDLRQPQVLMRSQLELPALVLLVDTKFKDYDSAILIQKILTGIEERIHKHANLILYGRTMELFRIRYDPQHDDITGVKSRLQQLMSTDIDYASIEALLSPLIATNHHAFGLRRQEIIMPYRLKPSSYKDSWSWDLEGMKKVKPVTWNNRIKIVTGLLKCVRERCMTVDPCSKLLLSPNELDDLNNAAATTHFQEWSLHREDEGLAAKFMQCFNNRERTTLEYKDLIERTLYRYKLEHPSALFGPLDYPEATRANGQNSDGPEVGGVDVDVEGEGRV